MNEVIHFLLQVAASTLGILLGAWLGLLAASSGLDNFNREADDREQLEAIRKYYKDKEDRRKAKVKVERRVRHKKTTREKQ